MVRTIGIGISYEGKVLKTLIGLSTDEKETAGLMNGSQFIEMDTGDVYYFDEESAQWILPGETDGGES